MNGNKDKASSIMTKQKYGKRLVRLATEEDHTLLAFDQKSTWSQKYNLVWDKLLDLNLFLRGDPERDQLLQNSPG